MASTDAGCTTIDSGIVFCGSELGWELVPSRDPNIDAMFRLDDKTYGMFIVEELGAADGNSLEFMRIVVIGHFATGAGIAEKDVTIFDVEASSLSGVAGETVTYGGKFKGLNVVFMNTVVIEENRSVQAVVYIIGAAPTEKSKAAHREFLAQTKLK